MSQTKAQLIQPIGVVTASGVVVSGVMTAGTFDGDVVGSATSIIQGTNLNLGAFNATSFAGDFTGNATGIITSSAIKVGSLTASSFVGDFTGTATSMAKGTGFKAGTVTATPADVTYTVTVSGGDFYLNSLQQPTPSLYPGATYTFDQSDSTNGTHPLRLATAADAAGSTEYTFQVTTNGTPGSAGAYTRIVVSPSAPDTLYYYCSSHSGMGGSINITNLLQGPVTGAVTGDVKGNISGNVTGNVTGNAVGAAGSVLSGSNIHVGVMTATSYSGDGSALTGIAATNFNTQTVAAEGAATTIDLSAGNMITFNQNANTTVSLANTSEAMDVTLIRPGGERSIAISYATGAVTIAGDDDYISIPASSDYDIGTGDFTFECWMYADSLVTSSHSKRLFAMGPSNADGLAIRIPATGDVQVALDNTSVIYSGDGGVTTSEWTHVALCRKSSVMTLYINGKIPSSTATATVTTDIDKQSGTFQIGANHDSPSTSSWNGEISNFRYVKGTAVYTEAFLPPTEALTNITNTKLLCCQSTSSATAAAVTPGTLTVNGTVTAGAATVSLAAASYPTKGTITWPDSVKWDGGSAPTLIGSDIKSGQQFQFLTRDSGLTWYAWEPFKNDVKNYQLWTWGTNSQSGVGALGQNAATNLSSPTQVGIEVTWRSLAKNGLGGEGSYMGSGIKGDGTLWIWGANNYGQLGQNNTTDQSSPVQIPGTTWDMHSLAREASYGIKTDGTIWSWGRNNNGHLAQNNTTDYSSPKQVGTDTTWSTVGAGENTALAIKTDGTLWSWGNGPKGKLGLNQPHPTKISSPTQVGTNTTWSKISAGGYGNFGIKTDGTLWGWGDNSNGYLAQNNTIQRSSPVRIGTGTDWDSISAEERIVMAVKTDGTMWAWGNNTAGALGQNQSPDSINTVSSPMQIPGTTWSIAAAAENGSMKAIKTDGTLWAWGRNYRGVLGLNQQGAPPNDVPAVYSSPVQVPGTNWVDVIGGKGRAATLRS